MLLSLLLVSLFACSPQTVREPGPVERNLAEKYPWPMPTDGIPPLDGTPEELRQGLKKIVQTPGTGKVPQVGSMVALHFNVYLATDGKMVDSTALAGRPVQMSVGHGKLVKALEIGLLTMKEGERARLLVPSDLGYKKFGSYEGKIPPHADLVYDVWLISTSE